MISIELARRLRDGGVRWDPAPGDRFVVVDRDMDDDVFTLAEMTVEVHDVPEGGRLLGFNGTTEWALDSVNATDALWLPSEAQLRELLAGTFCSLVRTGAGYEVAVRVGDVSRTFTDPEPAQAYGQALLHLVTGE